VRRILGLDVGSKRIGMAVSDPLGITAQGIETLERKNRRADLEQLRHVLERYDVGQIVVGNPLRMSGDAGVQSQRMTEFADLLRRHFAIPVHLWDERLTSAEANRVLRQAELSIRQRAGAVDRMAAVLILQSFLDARSARS
jgi:putative Holliday junction resolvase